MYWHIYFRGGAEQNITAPICISNTDRNVVVPNNVHDFSFDLAFLSQSTYGVLCGCPKAVYDSHACDLECFNNSPECMSYLQWFKLAIIYGVWAVVVVTASAYAFEKKEFISVMKRMLSLVKRKV